MMISVVIPTFEREELLCSCLEDVLRQQHPHFEAIVMDQTPQHRPETEAFLANTRGRVRHVRLNRPSVTAACNEGARLATGSLLVFLDDDIEIPDPNFLSQHEACHTDPAVGVVAGSVRDPQQPAGDRYDPRSLDPVWGWYHTRWDHDVRADVATAPGANMSCRRDLFWQIGGFDERFTGNAVRYENDFCLRARHAGYRILFEPSASVLHHYNSPGGHENRHLLGKTDGSHDWYRSYFRNMVYITLKHMPCQTWPSVLWLLWRGHVFNRPFWKMGPRFVAMRHAMFLTGLQQGLAVWWAARHAVRQHETER